MREAAVRKGRKGAVFEVEQGGISAFRAARRIPAPGLRPDPRHHAAGQQPRDVDLMRPLTEYDAAALACVELLGTPRAIQEVGVVEAVDHPHRAIDAALDQCA